MNAARVCRAAIAAFAAACFSLTGCQQNKTEVNHSAVHEESGEHYAYMVGQRYRTKVNLCLFTINGDMDYVYLGRNDGRMLYLSPLPATPGKGNIGTAYGPFTILDLVPTGSEFTILAETHEITSHSGIREKGGYPLGFLCRLNYNGKQQDGVFSEFIQTGNVAPPRTPNQRIDETIAEKIGQ